MIWNKYTIKTTTKDADMVSALLMDYDITDIQIENNVQLTDEELNQMYADFVKELPPDDGVAFINFYMEFEDDVHAKEQLEEVKRIFDGVCEQAEIFGLDPLELEDVIVDSNDWENNWKAYFKPFWVDDIVIKPTWEELPEGAEYKAVIEIDPGMAFGTGMHETTRLCLRGIRKYMQQGQTVYDLGCGSGILAIAALKEGASHAKAMDIDPQATAVAAENFEVNGIEAGTYEIFTGNILEDAELQAAFAADPRDLVVANILAAIICPLCKNVDKYMKVGGIFISSGIINDKEEETVNAVKANPNLEIIAIEHDGDWVSIVAKRVK